MITTDTLLIDTLNSIGNQYYDKYINSKSKLILKKEISSILSKTNELNLLSLDLNTRILFEFLFKDSQTKETLIDDLVPYKNKSVEINEYIEKSHQLKTIDYMEIFDKLIILKRYDLLVNNFEIISNKIFYFDLSPEDFLNIKDNYKTLYSLITNTKNIFLKVFVWNNNYAESEIENDMIQSLTQYHVDDLYLISKDSYTEEELRINVKSSIERIKLKRNDLNYNYGFLKRIKLWLIYNFSKKFNEENFEKIKI